MTLSEAIREGAKLRPQTFAGVYFATNTAGVFCSCAIGAALEAVGAVEIADGDTTYKNDDPYEVFPELYRDAFQCPECKHQNSMFAIITDHLNDAHKWTREHIADYLQGIGL